MSGVTCCSRLLGCSYLSPWVLPKPWVRTEPLCTQDEFLILGNRALFQHLSYQETVKTVLAVRDPRAAAKKLCTLAQSYGCRDNVGAVVVALHIGEDSCTCEPALINDVRVNNVTNSISISVPTVDPATSSTSSGIASEFSSETSASEVGSEAGSTASDEQNSSGPNARPERHCSLHPAHTVCNSVGSGNLVPGGHPVLFQHQPSSTFSSNQSDNGLDSDDEAPLDGVISNGSKLEVEVDIHCCAFQLRSGRPGSQKELDLRQDSRISDFPNNNLRRQNSVVVSTANGCLLAVCSREISDLKKSPSTSSLFWKKLSNGSIVAPEDSHNVIEVALEAPKKKSGYFAAPAQPDPEDQLIVPPCLEQEVREQLMSQNCQVVPGPPPSLTPPINRDPNWDQLPPSTFQQEVFDTAL